MIALMARTALCTWQGLEHEHNPKSADWYWALGIMTIASVIASILFGNYLLVLVIIAAATTLSLHHAKEPPLRTFHLFEHGIAIDEEFFPFRDMLSFSILEDIEGKFPPMLSIHTTRWLSPHLVIPLNDVDVDLVHNHLFEQTTEAPHHPTLVDVAARLFGF